MMPVMEAPQPESTPAAEPKRIVGIDALRGFDMLLLTGGAGVLHGLLQLACGGEMPAWLAAQFCHADWGQPFTCWDLVMPLFLFIVGASMPFAFARYREKGGVRWRRAASWRILRRVALLFVLGMLVQGRLTSAVPQHMSLFCNTLQAIAAGYLLASPFLMWGRVREQVVGCGCYLLLYWVALRFIPYGGHEGGRFLPDDNLAIYLDHLLQGSWQDGTPYSWILTSLAFGGITLMGVLGGQALRLLPGCRSVWVLSTAGVVCLLGALLLELDTPLIKHIFTTTMVLWSGGWCLLLLALFHLFFDLMGGRVATALAVPLRVVGCNAMLAYLLAECPGVGGQSLWWGIAHPLFSGVAAQLFPAHEALVFNTLSYALLWLVLWWLYRHRAFLRV